MISDWRMQMATKSEALEPTIKINSRSEKPRITLSLIRMEFVCLSVLSVGFSSRKNKRDRFKIEINSLRNQNTENTYFGTIKSYFVVFQRKLFTL